MSATGATIRPIDLDDLAASVDEETSQASSVRAGSLDTKCCRRTERVRPLEQLRVAARARPDLETAQHSPEWVERCGDVKIRVGVDSHDDTLGSLCDPDACHPRPRDAGMRLVRQRQVDGQYWDGPLAQAPIRSRSPR